MAADKGIISNNLLKSASGSYYGINLVTGTNALCTGNLNLTDPTKLYNASPSGLVTHYQKLVLKDNTTDRLVVDSTGALTLNTNKFTVDASGNALVAGTLSAGVSTLSSIVTNTITGTGTFNISTASGSSIVLTSAGSGDVALYSNAKVILRSANNYIDGSDNTHLGGTLGVTGLATLGSISAGNTSITGTLGVTSTGTFSDNIYIASGKSLSLNGSTSTWKLAFVTDRINIYCNDTVRGCFSAGGLDVAGALTISSTINTATITSGSLSSTVVSGLNINHAHTGGAGGTAIVADSITSWTGITQNIKTTGTLQVVDVSTLSSISTNTITGTGTFNLSTASNSSIVITSLGSGDIALYTNSKIFLRSANNYFDGSDRLYLSGFIYSADGRGITTTGTDLYVTNSVSKGLQVNSTAVIPYGTTTTLGSSAARWVTVYGVDGNFSGTVTATTFGSGTFTGNVSTGTYSISTSSGNIYTSSGNIAVAVGKKFVLNGAGVDSTYINYHSGAAAIEFVKNNVRIGLMDEGLMYVEGSKRVACGGGTTGSNTSATGTIQLYINGTLYYLLRAASA